MHLRTEYNPLSQWRLRRFRIGTRLRLVFAVVVLLMFLGSSFALWYLRAIRKDVETVSLVEERMSAVLEVDNRVLALMNQLHRSADLRERDHFESKAQALLSDFRSGTAAAARILHEIPPENTRQAVIIESLNGLLEALPGRVGALVELARADDWTAVHARLLNQVDRTDDVLAALVGEINRDLLESRQHLRHEVEQAELHSGEALAVAGLLSLLLAAVLGLAVTSSITRPLASLEAGTHALARGQFGEQLKIRGADELSQLARAFNQMARQLEGLYGKLRFSEARFRSLIENASDLILIVGKSGQIQYASPSTARVLGESGEPFMGRSIRNLLDSDEVLRAERMFEDVSHRARGTEPFELRFRHRDGSLRSMEGLATNLMADPAVE